MLGLFVVVSHQVRRPSDLAPLDLAEERTMTINVRQLRRVATGQAAPLLDLPRNLVKEADALTVAVPRPRLASPASFTDQPTTTAPTTIAADSPAAQPPRATPAAPAFSASPAEPATGPQTPTELSGGAS